MVQRVQGLRLTSPRDYGTEGGRENNFAVFYGSLRAFLSSTASRMVRDWLSVPYIFELHKRPWCVVSDH